MLDYIAATLLVGGAVFMLLAAIGVARMPDLFMRMQTSTKANTLGIAGVLMGAALHFADAASSARALLIIAFVYITAPVAAHLVARAAYLIGVPVWEQTRKDEWHEKQAGAGDQPPPNPTY